MKSALYYPHTEIRNEAIVKRALLTWDQLEFIAPYSGYRPYYSNDRIAEAMEIIGVARAPSEAERNSVHSSIVKMVEGGIPASFQYRPKQIEENQFDIWPQKFAAETWGFLHERGLVSGWVPCSDYRSSEAVGLTILSLLADTMAGTTRSRVTDRSLAYATISDLVIGNRPIENDGMESVIPLTFKSIAVEHIPIQDLIEFRKREALDQTGDYASWRHGYLKAIEEHVAAISNHPLGTSDRKELDRVFEQAMERKLRSLRRDIGGAKIEAVLNRDVMALVVATGLGVAAGLGFPAVIPPVFTATGAPLLALGGAVLSGTKFGSAKRKLLSDNPMAYLYELEKFSTNRFR